MYLMKVYDYSNWWEVKGLEGIPDQRVERTGSLAVIRVMKQHFARYGIPTTVISDNSPQFRSKEFESFSKSWDFENKTSDPGYPKGIGKAESAVKVAKDLMNKCAQSKSNPYIAILEARNIPTQDCGNSIAQH